MTEIIRELLKHLLQSFKFSDTNAQLSAAAIVGTALILLSIMKYWKRRIEEKRSRKIQNDLYPFFTEVEIARATKYYVPTKCQNIAPSREQEPSQTHAFATKELLIPFFLKNAFDDGSDQRYYLVLADSGMGKTTFSINLYIRLIKKTQTKFKIKLLPLASPKTDSEVQQIVDKRNTILILDALDEDSLAVIDYQGRINQILSLISDFRIVIITCRTQFFPSEDSELKETNHQKYGVDKGYHIFHKMYISPFDQDDIDMFIKKRYSLFKIHKRVKAKRIVRNSPNLMVRPMLLNYIDDLIESGSRFNFTSEIYETLINKWIDREARRVDVDRREIFRFSLYDFSAKMAMHLFKNRSEESNLVLDKSELNLFKENQQIQLETWEITGRSLLNRNSANQYKFSHKSIMEYFIAMQILVNEQIRLESLENKYDFAVLILREELSKTLLIDGAIRLNTIDWLGIGTLQQLLSEAHHRNSTAIQRLHLMKASSGKLDAKIISNYRKNIYKLIVYQMVIHSESMNQIRNGEEAFSVHSNLSVLLDDFERLIKKTPLFRILVEQSMIVRKSLDTFEQVDQNLSVRSTVHLTFPFKINCLTNLRFLPLMQSLWSLKIDFNHESDKLSPFLLSRLPIIPSLIVLELTGNFHVKEFEHLNNFKELQYLIISGNNLFEYSNLNIEFTTLKVLIFEQEKMVTHDKYHKVSKINNKLKILTSNGELTLE